MLYILRQFLLHTFHIHSAVIFVCYVEFLSRVLWDNDGWQVKSVCILLADFQTQRCLYIFAGERNRDHLNDIWLYHVDANEVQHITDVYCKDSLRGDSANVFHC